MEEIPCLFVLFMHIRTNALNYLIFIEGLYGRIAYACITKYHNRAYAIRPYMSLKTAL